MVATLGALRVGTIIATAIALFGMMPRDAVAKPCQCKDIRAMIAEIERVSKAEAAWMEIFAWARGLHYDVPEPSSNDELNTKYAQLARAPRTEWDRIMHAPIQQIEKLAKAGELDENGDPIVNENFAKAHCDDIVEGVRVHERAHRSFYRSPGNFIVGGLMSWRHLRLRSESEVVSYRTQKEFLKEKLDALKKRCKFKVNAKSEWTIPNGPPFTAIIDGAEISADAEGRYAGFATVNWAGTLIGSLACGSTMNFAPTRADLTGELEDNGQLVVTVTYQTAIASVHTFCQPGVSQTAKNPVTPNTLKLSVPSSGGVSTQRHELRGASSILGSVVIGVVPEKDH